MENAIDDSSEDDEPMGDEDLICPAILLTAAEKKMLRDQ